MGFWRESREEFCGIDVRFRRDFLRNFWGIDVGFKRDFRWISSEK